MARESLSPRARVFISCGQSRDTAEAVIATQLRDRLQEMGFDPYIGIEEQTLRGLKENIFVHLQNSEYFIFIDFKREKLGVGKPATFRGSLFSHQELALASYLDLDVLAFQEIGVKQLDGIMGFLQANAIEFSERRLLADLVIDQVRKRGWDINWRNELGLVRDPQSFTDAQILNRGGAWGRFFHIEVLNRHEERTARNCYAYLEKITKSPEMDEIPVKTVELKWEGYMLPSAHIAAQTRR